MSRCRRVVNNKNDEDDLFAQEMGDVAPIVKGRRVEHKTVPAETAATQQQRRDAAVGLTREKLDANFLSTAEVPLKEPLEYLEWKKNGVQRGVFANLRVGKYPIQASLDLHRKTVKEARDLVYRFLRLASARDQRHLLIAPGKGEFSDTPARLKSYLAYWLEEHPEVIAFSSAQPRHGGVGAVYVLVRKSLSSKELNRERHGQKSDQSQL